MKSKKQPSRTTTPAVKSTGLEFKDSMFSSPLLDIGIAYYEKLGVSVAVFVGGGAVVKYANLVFQPLPAVPMIVGSITMMVSMLMMVFVSFRAWHDLMLWKKRKLLSVAILAVLILNSVFFLIAGGTAAFKQLAS
jgi:hypothetical protein